MSHVPAMNSIAYPGQQIILQLCDTVSPFFSPPKTETVILSSQTAKTFLIKFLLPPQGYASAARQIFLPSHPLAKTVINTNTTEHNLTN